MLFWALVALVTTAQSRKAKIATISPALIVATTVTTPMTGVAPPLTTAAPLAAVHRVTTASVPPAKTRAISTAQTLVKIVTRPPVLRT